MKILNIESQIIESSREAYLLYTIIELAKEAGYTQVNDNWGHKAWDEYTIDEALEKFKPLPEEFKPLPGDIDEDDLPF